MPGTRVGLVSGAPFSQEDYQPLQEERNFFHGGKLLPDELDAACSKMLNVDSL